MIVRAAPPAHLSWIAERAGLVLHPAFMAIMAAEDGDICESCRERNEPHGRIVGAVGYDSWWDGAVGLHIALDSPIALRRLCAAGFGAAFDAPPRGFGKRAVTATVLATNEKSLRLVRHLGFRHVHTGKGYGAGGVDVEFFELRREECRFIPRALRRAA